MPKEVAVFQTTASAGVPPFVTKLDVAAVRSECASSRPLKILLTKSNLCSSAQVHGLRKEEARGTHLVAHVANRSITGIQNALACGQPTQPLTRLHISLSTALTAMRALWDDTLAALSKRPCKVPASWPCALILCRACTASSSLLALPAWSLLASWQACSCSSSARVFTCSIGLLAVHWTKSQWVLI